MFGGLSKSASRIAFLAAAGILSGGIAAQAADLGGNCCADLEERVAELEATTARKGNRKVSLEVSGHVHEAIVFYDVDGQADATLNETNAYIGTHNSSRSRFRFKGKAKINADWSAGFLMELGVRANHLGSVHQNETYDNRGIDIRHEALYVKSKSLGTIWLGWTSAAADGITEICLGCGLGNYPDWSDDAGAYRYDGGTFGGSGAVSGTFIGEGDRREVVRYISPTLAGFVFSSSYGQDDYWDVALRYAGEFGAIRVAAGVGYMNDTSDRTQYAANGGGAGPFTMSAFCRNSGADVCESIGASASIMHTPTGLYVAGAWGQMEDKLFNETDQNWHVTVGVNSKFNSLGKTNIWGMYTDAQREIGQDSELQIWGVGINQKIDAAAMEIYVWYTHYDAENTTAGETGEMDMVTVGSRIKF